MAQTKREHVVRMLLPLPVILIVSGLPAEPASEPARFIRGDVNRDGIVSQADVFSMIRFFQSRRLPLCADAADIDDSGTIGIPDLINVVAFLYWRGQPPAPPYRTAGLDPTPDDLDCEALEFGKDRLVVEPARRESGRTGGGAGDEDDGHVIDFLEFYVHEVDAYPGEGDIRVPILLTNILDIDGFTICVHADPTRVWLEGIDLPRYMPGHLRPEFQPFYADRKVDGYLGRSVYMDYLEPFEGNVLSRGQGATVAYLKFGISPDAPIGDKVLINFEDIPPADDLRPAPFNEISSDGQSYRPRFDGRGIEVTIVPRNVLFLRGDPNGDEAINITDMILILRYLFLGEDLECLDPADVDDSGELDISDVIALGDHLFGSGSILRPPFPNPGRDPTSDSLRQCP
jgi:hypothetical protein